MILNISFNCSYSLRAETEQHQVTDIMGVFSHNVFDSKKNIVEGVASVF